MCEGQSGTSESAADGYAATGTTSRSMSSREIGVTVARELISTSRQEGLLRDD